MIVYHVLYHISYYISYYMLYHISHSSESSEGPRRRGLEQKHGSRWAEERQSWVKDDRWQAQRQRGCANGWFLRVRTGQRRGQPHWNHDSWEAHASRRVRTLFRFIAWPWIPAISPKESPRYCFLIVLRAKPKMFIWSMSACRKANAPDPSQGSLQFFWARGWSLLLIAEVPVEHAVQVGDAPTSLLNVEYIASVCREGMETLYMHAER